MIEMTFKQILYNFLAIIADYEGYHNIAWTYREDKMVDKSFVIIDLITFPIFPLWIILNNLIHTHQFHKPNCNCYKYIKENKS